MDVGPIVPSIQSKKEHVPGDLAAVRTFFVSMHSWKKNAVALPDRFILRISFESLDFVHPDTGVPLVQFPFQNILCWGSSNKVFQFSIFDVENCLSGRSPDTIPIYLRTTEGNNIETWIMENVRKLMSDMDKPHAVTKEEFRGLKNLIFQVGENASEDATAASSQPLITSTIDPDENREAKGAPPSPSEEISVEPPVGGCLREDWLQVIDQFSCNGRKFLTKQGMELLILIGPLQPFEKFDLALLLYDRILNSESYQLIINTFEDEAERENLILRLGMEKNAKDARSGKLTPSCKIMQEYVPTPGSPVPKKDETAAVGPGTSTEVAAAGPDPGPGPGTPSSRRLAVESSAPSVGYHTPPRPDPAAASVGDYDEKKESP